MGTASPAPAVPDREIAREASRRRTFAIISHPDAGKTTLTEKLLLYGGAIDLAGSVRRKAHQRATRSDWLEMEQARGISVTSTVLQFEHGGCSLNLLDTPGHQDFSEDTYRVLTAVDSAVMVLDAAKGVEPQTRKLFEVCRQRGLPVLTFVNKLDLPAREPLDLLDEIEKVLGMTAVPVNWPIGMGSEFAGVFERETSKVLHFDRMDGGQRRAAVQFANPDDPGLEQLFGKHLFATFREDMELLALVGHVDMELFLAGKQTPVFFGSAVNNFGVGPFLDALVDMAPSPRPWPTAGGTPVDPASPSFSGFVFKIQANMDRQHRDSMAFVRVVSGRFRKGMAVNHPRLERSVRLPRAHRVFAQERETTEDAFAGDVVGLVNPGMFVIGDTISEDASLRFPPLPRFEPERFGRLSPATIEKQKAFRKGLQQLEEEGAVQVLFAEHTGARRDPILAAVGELQFDLVRARLDSEYGVPTRLEPLRFVSSRLVEAPPEALPLDWSVPGVLPARDREERLVALFEDDWSERRFKEKNPRAVVRGLGGAETPR